MFGDRMQRNSFDCIPDPPPKYLMVHDVLRGNSLYKSSAFVNEASVLVITVVVEVGGAQNQS